MSLRVSLARKGLWRGLACRGRRSSGWRPRPGGQSSGCRSAGAVDMGYIRFIELCSLSLFFGVLLCLEVGRRIGIWRSAHAAEGTAAEGRVVEGVIFGLLG